MRMIRRETHQRMPLLITLLIVALLVAACGGAG